MILDTQNNTNPLKPLWIGACRFLLKTYAVLVFGFHFFSSDWNYKCGLYLTK